MPRKTHPQKILHVMAMQDTMTPIFNRKLANRKYRKLNPMIFDRKAYIHNSVMRAARKLSERGVLMRVSRGQYTVTSVGRKMMK